MTFEGEWYIILEVYKKERTELIYKHMYCGYKKNGKITLKKNEKIITSSAAHFEDMTFLYFETKDPSLTVKDVAEGEMKLFPNGDEWFEMSEIFHYFTPANDGEWERKIKNKKAVFRINKLNRDKVASYIYHHVWHQNCNNYDCDRFFSIFIYGNVIVMYSETPEEKVTWQDIEGRPYSPNREDWGELMNEHFAAWPDGEKKWVLMERE